MYCGIKLGDQDIAWALHIVCTVPLPIFIHGQVAKGTWALEFLWCRGTIISTLLKHPEHLCPVHIRTKQNAAMRSDMVWNRMELFLGVNTATGMS